MLTKSCSSQEFLAVFSSFTHTAGRPSADEARQQRSAPSHTLRRRPGPDEAHQRHSTASHTLRRRPGGAEVYQEEDVWCHALGVLEQGFQGLVFPVVARSVRPGCHHLRKTHTHVQHVNVICTPRSTCLRPLLTPLPPLGEEATTDSMCICHTLTRSTCLRQVHAHMQHVSKLHAHTGTLSLR